MSAPWHLASTVDSTSSSEMLTPEVSWNDQVTTNESFTLARDSSNATSMSEAATRLLELEDMVMCPGCGLPVTRPFMRRIPQDDGSPSSSLRFRALTAPAQPGHDWICSDCLGHVGDEKDRTVRTPPPPST